MAIVVKKLFNNASNQKQFTDLVTLGYDSDMLEPVCKALCNTIPDCHGIYCIDMEAQVILQKWVFDTSLDPPAPVRVW